MYSIIKTIFCLLYLNPRFLEIAKKKWRKYGPIWWEIPDLCNRAVKNINNK